MDAAPLRQDRFYVRVGTTRIPFQTPTSPHYANLADFAECCLCGAVVDVGGELTEHAREHADGYGAKA